MQSTPKFPIFPIFPVVTATPLTHLRDAGTCRMGLGLLPPVARRQRIPTPAPSGTLSTDKLRHEQTFFDMEQTPFDVKQTPVDIR